MRTVALASPSRSPAEESALRVAVVAALSATMMLFASLASALLVRRSFEDWRPAPSGAWPWILLGIGLAASAGMEIAARSPARRRMTGFAILGLSSSLYLAGALFILGALVSSQDGLSRPHDAFIALLLGVHVLHAILGSAFAARVLRAGPGGSSEIALARLVTHFLTALLVFILALLFLPR